MNRLKHKKLVNSLNNRCFLSQIILKETIAGFLPGSFLRGGKIYCYVNFLCYANFLLFSDQISGGQVSKEGQTASGGVPCGRKPD